MRNIILLLILGAVCSVVRFIDITKVDMAKHIYTTMLTLSVVVPIIKHGIKSLR